MIKLYIYYLPRPKQVPCRLFVSKENGYFSYCIQCIYCTIVLYFILLYYVKYIIIIFKLRFVFKIDIVRTFSPKNHKTLFLAK